jgi:hypothetical protein
LGHIFRPSPQDEVSLAQQAEEQRHKLLISCKTIHSITGVFEVKGGAVTSSMFVEPKVPLKSASPDLSSAMAATPGTFFALEAVSKIGFSLDSIV